MYIMAHVRVGPDHKDMVQIAARLSYLQPKSKKRSQHNLTLDKAQSHLYVTYPCCCLERPCPCRLKVVLNFRATLKDKGPDNVVYCESHNATRGHDVV